MLTICHLENSRSERIVWLCEELGVPYELQRYRREPTGLAPAAFKAVHPLGRAPIVKDGDLTLIESGAIIEYILARYGRGRLRPASDAPDFPRYLQFLHFAEGSAMQHLFAVFILNTVAADANHAFRDLVRTRILEDFAYLNEELGRTAYLAGDHFTAADINMYFVIRFARDYVRVDLGRHANLGSYLARIEARAAFKKALALI